MNRSFRNTAFYLEALSLLLIFLVSLTVLVQLLGAARGMGLSARHKTQAAQITRTVSAEFLAGAGDFATAETAAGQGESIALAQQRQADGTRTAAGSSPDYQVEIRLTGASTAAGRLVTAAITVTPAATSQGSPACETELSRYLPANIR